MNNIDDVLKRYSDKEEINRLKKWLSDYIVPLDKNEITWLQLDYKELSEFINNNYLDNGNYVGWYNSMLYNVLGMKYLAYSNIVPGYSYLIAVIPNNLGKKTIIACLCYEKKRKWSMLQEKPVNSIQMIETNQFYRKQGIFNALVAKVIDCLDLSLDLVVTDEYDDGLSCHTVSRLKNILSKQGYDKEILTRSEYDEKRKKNINYTK